MSDVVTHWTEDIAERATAKITGTFQDLDATGFKPTALTAMVYDVATGTVLRAKASVLDANGGTVSAEGAFVLELVPLDNRIVSTKSNLTLEKHILLLEWSWDSGVKQGKQEVHFYVRNFSQVTT